MVMQKLCLVLLSIAIFAEAVSAESPDLLIEVFRHGARAPDIGTYDRHNYWSNRLGQLTPVGMRMHYVLGAALRERYPELLSKYDPEKIYVRSTAKDRTITSAYAHMQGVFQQSGPVIDESVDLTKMTPTFGDESLKQLFADIEKERYALPGRVQAVPIHTLPFKEDHSLKGWQICVKQAEWHIANLADVQTLEIFSEDMERVLKYLNKKDIEVNDFSELGRVAEAAITSKMENLRLPGGIHPDSQMFKDLKFVYEFFYAKTVEALPMQRALYAKPLLEAILSYVDDFLHERTPRNAIFLSAHDVTLMTLLAAFNITNTDCLLDNYRHAKKGKMIKYPDCVFPEFASNLIFEVYRTPQPSIAFYYDGKPMNLCGKADNRCTVSEFIDYTKQVTNFLTMEDYYSQCDPMHSLNQTHHKKVRKNKMILQTSSGFTQLEIILMVLAVVLSLSIVGHWVSSQKNENENSSLMKKKSIEFQSISDDSRSEVPEDTPNDVSQAAQEC